MTGTSNTFIVFPGSSADTGLLRQTSIALMYSGPYTVIQGVVDAFNVSLIKSNYHKAMRLTNKFIVIGGAWKFGV